jgi:hypothetical protein
VQNMRAVDQAEIVVGKPLGFSIYGGDKTLLLAEGHLVPNEFVRQGLVRSGKYRSDDVLKSDSPTALVKAISPGWHFLISEYSQLFRRSRVGFRMTSENAQVEGTARCLGASDEGALLMTAPMTTDKRLIAVEPNQLWTVRVFYAQYALRFNSRVAAVVREPFPHFYLHSPEDVELHNVRKWPRATVCLPASRSGDPARLIVDLGVGGARVAIDAHSSLQQGQSILLNFLFRMLDGEQSMSIDAEVLNAYGRTDPAHPDIAFYGVRFLRTSQQETFLLHAYVQEQLHLELDRVRQVLIRPAKRQRAAN